MINRNLKHLDVSISINSPLWKTLVSKTRLKKIVSFILNRLSLYQDCATIELSVRLTDDAEIQAYNAKYRNKNAPTNVLSFPTSRVHPSTTLRYAQGGRMREPVRPERRLLSLSKEPESKDERMMVGHVHLGDIMLAFETIAKEASEQGKNFDDHIIHLFVHSVLHLLGFTHDKKKDRDIMEQLEIEILKAFNIESPYE